MKWFKQYGLVYLPISTEGMMVSFFAVLFMIPVCMAVVKNGHSVTDDLYKVFVYASCTAFWWKWIADKTSIEKNESTTAS